MTYDNSSHINTQKDVDVFYPHQLFNCKLNFHSESDFADNIDSGIVKSFFEENDVKLYNRLMGDTFEPCEKSGANIYEIGVRQQKLAWRNM